MHFASEFRVLSHNHLLLCSMSKVVYWPKSLNILLCRWEDGNLLQL